MGQYYINKHVSLYYFQTFVESNIALQRKTGGSWWTGLNDRTSEGVWIFNGENALPDPSLLYVFKYKIKNKYVKESRSTFIDH